ncbi:MAG TPA: TetR/AcrR family transcriptional regulator [Caulobacteraceae bacterium]|jgi:AcrR family transcriptional regulator|nr:TetR/AcrR family transcriptional regulator [Caulobacteraceae bacterium]
MTGRTKKAEARRAEILATASACFRAKGIRGASVNDICSALGISPGHLYYYFDSKEAIVAALVEQHREAAVAHTRDIAVHDDALDRLFRVAPEDRVADRPRGLDPVCVWELLAEAARGEPYAVRTVQRHWKETGDEIRLIVEAAQRRGRVRADADLDAMMTIIALYFMTSQMACFADPAYRQERYLGAANVALAPFVVGPPLGFAPVTSAVKKRARAPA